MKYTMNGTTKRYSANQNCKYGSFTISTDAKYQYDCEFEFYIDTDFYDYTIVVDEIAKEIYEFTDVDILVDIMGLPTDKDKNNCIQIKPDISLEEHGIEISVPTNDTSRYRTFYQEDMPHH